MSESESKSHAEQKETAGFLSRWSKRKASSAGESAAAPTNTAEPEDRHSHTANTTDHLSVNDAGLPAALVEEGTISDEAGLEVSDEIILTDADMPPIESLDSKSDVSMFLNKGVSDTLRKAAFRRLFSLPAYNIRDGLNDYDEDYTSFEPLGDTITSDMKFHAARKERERLAREAELAREHEAEQLPENEDDEPETQKPPEQQTEEQLQQDEPIATDDELMADSGEYEDSLSSDPLRIENNNETSTDVSELDTELSELDSDKSTTSV